MDNDLRDMAKEIEALKAKLAEHERREAERKQADRGWWGESFEDGVRLLQAIMDFIPAGLTMSQGPEMKIPMISQFGQNLIGRPFAAIKDPPRQDVTEEMTFLHADGVTPAGYDDLPLVRASRGETILEEEWVLLRPDGDKVPILLAAGPIRDKDGRVTGALLSWVEMIRRKQLERTLKESEERFRATFEQTAVGMAHVALDGTFIRNNQRYSEITGYSMEELKQRTVQDLTFPNDWEAERDHANAVLAGERATDTLEKRYVRKDGSVSWASLTLSVVRKPNGEPDYFVRVVQDIGRRKQADIALQRSEELLRRVLYILPVGIFIADSTGRIVQTNPAVEKIWRGTRHVPIEDYREYKGWWADTGQRIESEQWALARAITKGEESFAEVIDIERFDGTRGTILNSAVPVRDEQGNIVLGVAVIADITELRHTQEELQRSRDEFQNLAENAPDHILRYDRNLYYLYANPAVEDLLGIPAKNFIGKKLGDQGLPEDLRLIIEKLIRAVFETGQSQTLEWQVETPIGLRHFHSLLAPETDRTGQVKTVLAISRDITELKHLEMELRKAKEQAEEASRAKSSFLANMSHEIRTPMNGIIGMTELALMSEPKPEVREYLGLVNQSAGHLLTLINDILDLARLEVGRMELHTAEFDLSSMIDGVVKTMTVSAEKKGLTLHSTVQPRSPRRIVGDENRLRQILINLVGNAIKFTHQGMVKIDVTTAANTCHASFPNGVCLVFAVSDTGIGIPAEKISSIFETFARAENEPDVPPFEGSGLGLSISKSLIEMMGGTIWVDCEAGQGSTFYFSIAVGVSKEEVAEEAHEEAMRPAIHPMKILLAEDNAINRMLAVAFLEKRGHMVTAVENGREAVEALKGEPFDAVLMDIRMPEMSGEKAVEVIKVSTPPGIDPKTPVVALTAHALAGDRERFLAQGFDDYLTKPIDLEELDRVLMHIQEQ